MSYDLVDFDEYNNNISISEKNLQEETSLGIKLENIEILFENEKKYDKMLNDFDEYNKKEENHTNLESYFKNNDNRKLLFSEFEKQKKNLTRNNTNVISETNDYEKDKMIDYKIKINVLKKKFPKVKVKKLPETLDIKILEKYYNEYRNQIIEQINQIDNGDRRFYFEKDKEEDLLSNNNNNLIDGIDKDWFDCSNISKIDSNISKIDSKISEIDSKFFGNVSNVSENLDNTKLLEFYTSMLNNVAGQESVNELINMSIKLDEEKKDEITNDFKNILTDALQTISKSNYGETINFFQKLNLLADKHNIPIIKEIVNNFTDASDNQLVPSLDEYLVKSDNNSETKKLTENNLHNNFDTEGILYFSSSNNENISADKINSFTYLSNNSVVKEKNASISSANSNSNILSPLNTLSITGISSPQPITSNSIGAINSNLNQKSKFNNINPILSVDPSETINSYYPISNKGPQGPQGPQGIAGPIGNHGPEGIPGAIGIQGPQGVPGLIYTPESKTVVSPFVNVVMKNNYKYKAQ